MLSLMPAICNVEMGTKIENKYLPAVSQVDALEVYYYSINSFLLLSLSGRLCFRIRIFSL